MKEKPQVTAEGHKMKYNPPVLCSRCGNDLSKGAFYWHLPFEKRYIAFCHICNLGMIFGMYSDFLRAKREIDNG